MVGEKKDGRRRMRSSKVEENDVKCGKCDKFLWAKPEEAEENEAENKNLECEVCARWFHASCCDIDDPTFTVLQKQQLHWYCKDCNQAAIELHNKVTVLQKENLELRKDLTTLTKIAITFF